MGVIQKPLTSTSGFKSPGFIVDAAGNFTIANLNTTSNYKINGVSVLSEISLGSSVVSSSLTSVGVLTGLGVNSASNVDVSTTANLMLTSNSTTITSTNLVLNSSGALVISSGTTGNLDNVDIGTTTPGNGTFNNLIATDTLFVGSQNIKALSAALAVALS